MACHACGWGMSRRSMLRSCSMRYHPVPMCCLSQNFHPPVNHVTPIWMRHVTNADESFHTYEWVMSHTRMESCQTCGWVISHMWMSHVTHVDGVMPNTWMRHVTYVNESYHTYGWSHAKHLNEVCHKCGWVMSHIWMESCQTYECVKSQMRTSHVPYMDGVMPNMWMTYVTHVNESCHIFGWVMSNIWMSHVTHVNER